MLSDWDPRLISPERALRLTGDWPVRVTCEYALLSQFEPEGGGPGQQPDRVQVNLRCGRCDQSVMLLGSGAPGELLIPVAAVATTAAEIMSAVLRHLVMAHDQPLSAAAEEGRVSGG